LSVVLATNTSPAFPVAQSLQNELHFVFAIAKAGNVSREIYGPCSFRPGDLIGFGLLCDALVQHG